MKSILMFPILGAALLLGACAIQTQAPTPAGSSPSAQAVAPSMATIFTMTPTQACSMWATALKVGATMPLNAVQVQQVGILETQINPLCSGAEPPTGTQVQAEINAALINLAAIEAVTQTVKYSAPSIPSTQVKP